MTIKKISEEEFTKFANNSPLKSFYESVEWYHLKQNEGKKCELVGLYKGQKLVGASLIIYVRVLRKFYMAYASRGFLYDYKNIKEFKEALKKYFSKDVIFFRMDPPVILASYDKNLNKEFFEDSSNLIKELKENKFIHYGFNNAYETMQFRFVMKMPVLDNMDNQLLGMNKSTKKNINLAVEKGVCIKKGTIDDLDLAYELFEKTNTRRNIQSFKKKFYLYLLNEFKDDAVIYLAYIDKSIYIHNMEEKLDNIKDNIFEIKKKMETYNVGHKLKKQLEEKEKEKEKVLIDLKEAQKLKDITYIGSMISIFKFDEAVSLVSGMDNDYRKFCPKYAMYPAMIKDAIEKKYKYINFLGVKNIFDSNDSDYGVYEIKKGFGASSIEYIGEFDLPFNKVLYRIYKFNENRGRKK